MSTTIDILLQENNLLDTDKISNISDEIAVF